MNPALIFGAFSKLFNADISTLILSYTNNDLMLLLRDCFPLLLKNITITENNLYLIGEPSSKYIQKMHIKNSTIFDRTLIRFSNVTELQCAGCNNITDDSSKRLTRLVKLDCSYCNNITSEALKHLTRLTELNFSTRNVKMNGM